MYTVFESSGAIRRNVIGLAVFVPTLAAARSAARPGDTVTRWSNGGSALKRWAIGTDGRARPIGGRP